LPNSVADFVDCLEGMNIIELVLPDKDSRGPGEFDYFICSWCGKDKIFEHIHSIKDYPRKEECTAFDHVIENHQEEFAYWKLGGFGKQS
jgi:hypothetical protein